VRQLTTSDLELNPSFDLVCAFEVLEHLEHDVEELKRWRRLLHPGGHVLVSVPAHRSRFGPADEAVGHYRRYDRGDLNSLLTRAGLEVLWIEAWGLGLGHLLEWLRHRLASNLRQASAVESSARSGRWMQPGGFPSRALFAALAAPFRLLQHPFRRGSRGIGWIALARNV
jgi:SAM-dependent methyltransferase